MNRLIYITFLLVFSFTSQAQVSFENRIKEIKRDIEIITAQEKETLRMEVEEINDHLEKKEITVSEAEIQKKAKAEKCADRIEARVEPLEREIQNLVKGEIEIKNDDERISSLDEDVDENINEELEEVKGDVIEGLEDIKDEVEKIKSDWHPKKRKYKSEARTTTQFVFAFGLNNLIKGSDLNSIDNNGIKLSNSRFYEWGWTWKTRLAKNSAALQLKYGVSLTYNNLRPDNNQYYVKTGQLTSLISHPQTLTDEPYFRTTNLVVPVHLEFDFSKKRVKDENVIVKSQKSFRLGIGGYAGLNVRTKQLLEYKADGLRSDQITRGDYNTSSIVYGVSGYIGYKDFSIYTKYDLNPIFSDMVVDQNNISLGVRFDFN